MHAYELPVTSQVYPLILNLKKFQAGKIYEGFRMKFKIWLKQQALSFFFK